MGVALAYFLHKIMWFFRLRALQVSLVRAGMDRLKKLTGERVDDWSSHVKAVWARARETRPDDTPFTYVDRQLDELGATYDRIRDGRTPVRSNFVERLGTLEGNQEEAPGRHQMVAFPRRDGSVDEVSLLLDFEGVAPPEPPDSKIYSLERGSRYGLLRRLLVIAVGAVDVVYSSRHVARMTQNSAMPTGIIIRRLSLVAIILLVVALDVAFGARRKLIAAIDERFGHLLIVDASPTLSDFIAQYGATILGHAAWLSVYGLVYLSLYLVLRRQSDRYYRALKALQQSEEHTLGEIYDTHRDNLLSWAADFGDSLDDAADISVDQASMLIARAKRRMFRRLAPRELIDCAQSATRALFNELPESSDRLEDVANTRRHSWSHFFWPKAEELKYQVKISQYRTAWRDLDMLLQDITNDTPDVQSAQLLWSELVAYAGMFPDTIPADTVTRLREALGPMVQQMITESEAELEELDQRLGALTRALSGSMDTAVDLIANRIELTNQSIERDVREYTREVIQAREKARLEAIAFEI